MNVDKLLIFIVIMVLLGIGVLMVYSTSAIPAQKQLGDEYFYIKRQFMWIVVGAAAFTIMCFINCNFWKKASNILLGATVTLLICVLIPGVGKVAGGARQWLSVGFLNVQPSEIAKLTTVIFMAGFLTRRQKKIKEFWYGFVPPFLVLIIVAILVGVPDFGTAILISAVIFSMLLIGGINWKYLLLCFFVSLPAICFMVKIKDYRFKRILIFLDPWSDSRGAGWQLTQSFIALGSGGLAGLGLGKSIQKMGFLPESHTDFIFSIIGEEMGFFGGVVVIICFVVLLVCGLRIALRAKDLFSHLLAIGIVLMIGFQSVINIGVATGCLPVTGIPLPLISYGGSNLVICMASIGILFNIATRQDKDIGRRLKRKRVVRFKA